MPTSSNSWIKTPGKMTCVTQCHVLEILFVDEAAVSNDVAATRPKRGATVHWCHSRKNLRSCRRLAMRASSGLHAVIRFMQIDSTA